MTSEQTLSVNASDFSASERDYSVFINEALMRETDRGCVILGGSILRNDLEGLLRASFRNDERNVKSVINPLFEEYGPLATLFARIQLAFAMKLISKSVQLRLLMVRKIENDFSQELGPTDFDDPRCHHPLAVMNWLGEDTEEKSTSSDGLVVGEHKPFTNRIAFSTAVARLSVTIRSSS